MVELRSVGLTIQEGADYLEYAVLQARGPFLDRRVETYDHDQMENYHVF